MAFNFRKSDPDDDNQAATPPLPPGTPEELQPPAEPVTPEPRQNWHRQPIFDVPGMDWKSARRAAIMAGIIGGLGSLFPPVVFLFWILAAGGISITIYRRQTPHSQVTPANGFRMGAMTGFIGFALNTIITGLGMLSSQVRAQFRQNLQETLSNMTASNPDPVAQRTAAELANWVSTPGGMATLIIVAMIIFSIFFIIIAGVGGSIGASLFGKHESTPAR